MQINSLEPSDTVNRAFSKQSAYYDDADKANPILTDMRTQVYHHVSAFIRPRCHILEINAGTGIDALHFARSGHTVLATDVSDGMVEQITRKIRINHLDERLSCLQLSYDELDRLSGHRFDYVFSNFGGLNCIKDLSRVTRHLPGILNPGACLTWVIMPPVCLWELAGLLKGRGSKALRRFHENGTLSHLDGYYFMTHYHSFAEIRSALGRNFKLKKKEGLGAVSPPPHRGEFPRLYPTLYKYLRRADGLLRHHFPFNRWADHIITTFEYDPT